MPRARLANLADADDEAGMIMTVLCKQGAVTSQPFAQALDCCVCFLSGYPPLFASKRVENPATGALDTMWEEPGSCQRPFSLDGSAAPCLFYPNLLQYTSQGVG